MKKILLILMITINVFALVLPENIYKKVYITPESSYPIYKIMTKARELYSKGKVVDASELFIKAITKASTSKRDKNIDQYDYLFANYAILQLLQAKGDEENYKKLAKHVLRYLDKTTNSGKDIWEEGELGKFQLKMYKTIANHYAKILYKESNRKDKKLLNEALKYAKKAETFIRDDSDFYLKDTRKWIENAIAGYPPLKGENETIEIIKEIKSKKAL